MDRTFTENDAASLVALQNAENFTIALEENPTTGYRWNLQASDSDAIKVLGSDYQPGGGGVGAGGQRTFRLQAARVGDHTVTLELRRSWEAANAAQSHTFRLQVR